MDNEIGMHYKQSLTDLSNDHANFGLCRWQLLYLPLSYCLLKISVFAEFLNNKEVVEIIGICKDVKESDYLLMKVDFGLDSDLVEPLIVQFVRPFFLVTFDLLHLYAYILVIGIHSDAVDPSIIPINWVGQEYPVFPIVVSVRIFCLCN